MTKKVEEESVCVKTARIVELFLIRTWGLCLVHNVIQRNNQMKTKEGSVVNLLVQTMRHNGWETVYRFFDIEEAFDKADDLSRSLLHNKIRVFEPIRGATYYGPELKEIVIHGLKIR